MTASRPMGLASWNFTTGQWFVKRNISLTDSIRLRHARISFNEFSDFRDRNQRPPCRMCLLPKSRRASMSRPPLPPIDDLTAAQKAMLAEHAGNSRDPARVTLGYATDSRWRNRAEFIDGRAA